MAVLKYRIELTESTEYFANANAYWSTVQSHVANPNENFSYILCTPIKLFKMDETEVPIMETVGVKRTMTTCTATANQLIKKCKAVPDHEKLEVILQGLEAATKEYMSIMLEKLDINDIVVHTPEAAALFDLDFKTLFDLEKGQMDLAKVGLGWGSLVTQN